MANVREANDREAALQRAKLADFEEWWRDKQKFLESRGYMLRPRYHPGWVPSWVKDESLVPKRCEDYVWAPVRPGVMDARRMSDNRLVYIKRVTTDSDEVKIAKFLSEDHIQRDPRCHCVPVLDVFPDDEDEQLSYMVMKFLRHIDTPDFDFVENIVDFVDQILEGLVFLHDQGVAHRDCAEANIMVDIDNLYPRGYHPAQVNHSPDMKTSYSSIRRGLVRVRYYYVDFGMSTRFLPGKPRLVTGELGRDRDAPELSDTIPYDPFKLDVFIIGNLLRTEFQERYANIDFLLPLIDAMTEPDPAFRPDAATALKKWKKIRRRVWSLHRAWRVRGYDEENILKWIEDTRAFFRMWMWFSLPHQV